MLRAVLKLANQLQTNGDLLYEEFSAKQWYLLCYVDGFGERPPTLTELAAEMGTSHQNTKQMVSKLVRKGFLRLEQDASDRRKTRVCLTEQVQPFWDRYLNIQDGYVRQLCAGIPPDELAVSLSTLERLIGNLRTLVQLE